MGRPDDSVLIEINGYKFKQAKYGDEDVHVISPTGVNFKFYIDVMEEFVKEVNSNSELNRKLRK